MVIVERSGSDPVAAWLGDRPGAGSARAAWFAHDLIVGFAAAWPGHRAAVGAVTGLGRRGSYFGRWSPRRRDPRLGCYAGRLTSRRRRPPQPGKTEARNDAAGAAVRAVEPVVWTCGDGGPRGAWSPVDVGNESASYLALDIAVGVVSVALVPLLARWLVPVALLLSRSRGAVPGGDAARHARRAARRPVAAAPRRGRGGRRRDRRAPDPGGVAAGRRAAVRLVGGPRRASRTPRSSAGARCCARTAR